jgi:hypothetical protein
MSFLPDLVLLNIFHFMNNLELLEMRKVCSQFDFISSHLLFNHMNEWNAILFILRKSQNTKIINPQFNVCIRSSFDNWILTITKKSIYLNSINHLDLCLHLISFDGWKIKETHLFYDQFIILQDFRIFLKIRFLGVDNKTFVFEMNFQEDKFSCSCHMVDLSKNWIPSVLSLITKSKIDSDDRYYSHGTHFIKKTHNSFTDRSFIKGENNQLICCERDILTGEIITQFPLKVDERVSVSLINVVSFGGSELRFHQFRESIYSTSFTDIIIWFSDNNRTFLMKKQLISRIFILNVIEKTSDFYFADQIGQTFFKIYCLTSEGFILESQEIHFSERFEKLSLVNSNLLFVSEAKSEYINFRFIKILQCNDFCEIQKYLVIRFIQ